MRTITILMASLLVLGVSESAHGQLTGGTGTGTGITGGVGTGGIGGGAGGGGAFGGGQGQGGQGGQGGFLGLGTAFQAGGQTTGSVISPSNVLATYYSNPLLPVGSGGVADAGASGLTNLAGGGTGGAGGAGGGAFSGGNFGSTGNGLLSGFSGVNTGTLNTFGEPLYPAFTPATATGGAGGGLAGQQGGFGGVGGTAQIGSTGIGSTQQTRPQFTYTAQLAFDPPPPAPSPQLQTNLQGVLGRSSRISNPQNIQVQVNDSRVVVLSGQVKSEKEARLAEAMLRLTPGVGRIKNDLTFPAR